MVEKSTLHRSHRPGGLPLLITHYALRVLQFTCALATVIIWGHHINETAKAGDTVHSDAIFSFIVAAVALIASIVWMVPKIVEWRVFFVDGVLAGLWLIVFAIWAKNYIPRNCSTQPSDCQGLKISAYFSLAAWLLWMATAVIGFILFNRDRKYTHAGSWLSTVRGGRALSGYPHSNV